MISSHFDLQSRARWLIHGNDYKARTMSERLGQNGELRHIEWNARGWGGNNTVVYLVFDQGDQLSEAAKNGLPGQYPGLPCQVNRVRRLESHWYTVQFYTDTEWEKCL